MKSNLNQKIDEIYENFQKEIQTAKDKKDKQIADLFEKAEFEYVEKIKKDINI